MNSQYHTRERPAFRTPTQANAARAMGDRALQDWRAERNAENLHAWIEYERLPAAMPYCPYCGWQACTPRCPTRRR